MPPHALLLASVLNKYYLQREKGWETLFWSNAFVLYKENKNLDR